MSRLTRWLLLAAVAASAFAFADTASAERYVVLYKQQAVPADAARTVERAGGTLVAAYNEIGVVISESSDPSFRANLMQDKRIDGASGTSSFGAEVAPVEAAGHDEQDPELPNAPATDADTFSPLQWDMRQIHTPACASRPPRGPLAWDAHRPQVAPPSLPRIGNRGSD